MVLSSDCISVAITVQTMMMRRTMPTGGPACAGVLSVIGPSRHDFRQPLEVPPDPFKRLARGGDLRVRNTLQHGVPHVTRRGLRQVDDRRSTCGQFDDLGTPVGA